MTQFELVWDSRCGVAESPVWDAASRRLLFCDIPGKRINALSVDDGKQTSWDFPEVVGSFGLCRSGRLVVALRSVLMRPAAALLMRVRDRNAWSDWNARNRRLLTAGLAPCRLPGRRPRLRPFRRARARREPV